MTIQPYTYVALPKTMDNKGVNLATWGPLANGDSGLPVALDNLSDRSIQIFGTFGAGGTIIWEGSNDDDGTGTVGHFVTLNDPFNVALSFTAAALKGIIEGVRYMRPRVTAGDGTTALTVYLFARGAPQNT